MDKNKFRTAIDEMRVVRGWWRNANEAPTIGFAGAFNSPGSVDLIVDWFGRTLPVDMGSVRDATPAEVAEFMARIGMPTDEHRRVLRMVNASDAIGRWVAEAPQNRRIELYLGDGHDFGERSGNMPKFHSTYKRLGGARCVASWRG